MVEVRALPCLGDRSVQEWIRLERPNTLDKTGSIILIVMEDGIERLRTSDLDLAVCPAWDLDDKVDDLLVGVFGIEGDVVPEGDRLAVFLEPDAPFLGVLVGFEGVYWEQTYQGVWGTDGPQTESVVVECRSRGVNSC